MTSATIRTQGRVGTASRLTPLEKLLLAAMIAVLFLAATWPLLNAERNPVGSTTIRVQAEDTLWSIAAAHGQDGVPTAQTVAEIRRLNGMTTSLVRAGSTLRVPSANGGRQAAWASR